MTLEIEQLRSEFLARLADIENRNMFMGDFAPMGHTHPEHGGPGMVETMPAWKTVQSGIMQLAVMPGDIEIAPDTVVLWADITDYTETIDIPTGQDYETYYVWVNVDLDTETATMLHGETVTALTTEEREHVRQKLVAEVLIIPADLENPDRIDIVRPLQCGNIDIKPAAISEINAAWYATKSGAMEITIVEGDIEIGWDTVIAWSSITGADTTIDVPTSESLAEYHVWVNVNVRDSTAELLHGGTITALTSDEQKYIRQKRIAKATVSGDVIQSVKALQCGNIDIARAA